ncbi:MULTISPECIES: RteC domain-containing protein [Bacteroidota]|uniref:RteC domain-containing protein n=1 Tax=Zunongwangia pacifica TaxID=2911062 RepID=A0A9X1ZSW9_9FLAO|nr:MULTISPECIES: RteC domain-containing protein [Bacteroidota]MCC4227138.1 RteC domain-containing protein [Zunongwangia profunda]MCL6218605.1 RteC domain-containing protein [Zunongwangia pacifica]UBZ07663.1 RteC domain-containing protein [Salegentibacter mishustinae]
MQKSIKNILKSYQEDINEIGNLDLDDFKNVEKGLQSSRYFLQKLRIVVRTGEFKNKEEEIKFFKKQKPFIYGNLKFFVKLYKHLLLKPKGSNKIKKIFIEEEIHKLQTYYTQNIDFIRYYRQNSSSLDEYYFLRGNDNIGLISDTSHFYTDAEFSTSHDNSVAKIIAYDLLFTHYLNELKKLECQKSNINIPVKRRFKRLDLGWTANKIDLVELIYALQASGAITGGKAGIKDMAIACEEIFDLDLGNYYRKFLEIRARKIEPTKFIDRMKSSLLKRMQDADE